MKEHISHGESPWQDELFFLSELLGRRLWSNGKRIGRLSDLVIVETEKLPYVTHLIVNRSFGYPSLLIPWDRVKAIGKREITAHLESIVQYEQGPPSGALLLRDYVLDKKVVDLEDREVEVVYDVKLVLRNRILFVTEVDFSRYGLLRRIHLKWLANLLASFGRDLKDETISWLYIQPLPTQIGSFKGDVKLKILRERLSRIHPVDLADILEDLEPAQRIAIFSELDTEKASDTLEEIDPHVQRELVSSLAPERVVQLINEMTPGQAADLLSALPSADAQDLLTLMNNEKSRKVHSILEKQEENILNYTTSKFLQFPPDITVKDAQQEYQQTARGKDVVMYLYVIDDEGVLGGVIDIKELLQANDDARLRDIMVSPVISLETQSTLKEAFMLFSRYDFRALPVKSEDEKMVGVVPYRDVMNLKHHFVE